jgi:hypothetical protein
MERLGAVAVANHTEEINSIGPSREETQGMAFPLCTDSNALESIHPTHTLSNNSMATAHSSNS